MRIGLFSDHPPTSPGAASLLRLGEELERLGHRSIAFFRPRSRVGIRVFRLPRRGLRGLEAAISHTPFSLGRTAGRIARRNGLPHLHLLQGRWLEPWPSLPEPLRPPPGPVVRRALALVRRATWAGVESARVRDALLQVGIRTPIHLLPWETSLAAFSPPQGHDLRRDLALPPTARVLLHVGDLSRSGRFLLGAFRALVGPWPEAFLVLVGGGPVAEGLAGEAQRLGVSPRIRLPGDIDPARLPDYYRQADVLLHVPGRAPKATPVLAAMAAGLPVVTTPGPALVGLVEPGVNVLLAPEDEPGFARAVSELLRDGDLRARLRERGLATAQGFSPAAIARRIAELISTGRGDAGAS